MARSAPHLLFRPSLKMCFVLLCVDYAHHHVLENTFEQSLRHKDGNAAQEATHTRGQTREGQEITITRKYLCLPKEATK